MLKSRIIARDFGGRFQEAADYARNALCEERAEQEPSVTDRMLGAMERSFSDDFNGQFCWKAKTLTDRGRSSQESIYGADFLGVLAIDIDGYRVTKGFLAQAKIMPIGSKSERDRLMLQCELMLRYSPASYVFLYSCDSFNVVPAISVIASAGHCEDLYSRGIDRFFQEHIECFLGDRKIASASPGALRALAEAYSARAAFYISVGEPEESTSDRD